MIDLTATEHLSRQSLAHDALAAVTRVLDMALTGISVTAADVLACCIAAVTLGDEVDIERAFILLRTSARNYCAADVSAAAARDFALAYHVLTERPRLNQVGMR